MNLYMLVIGGKPEGRFTEQHDVFFGIGDALKDLVPALNSFWPELANKMHVDSWRKVTSVDGYEISVEPKNNELSSNNKKLFFVNLGGYKPNDMEEYHYKQLVVAKSLAEASRIAKDSVFYKHHDSSHIDDKYGIDVDDIYEVSDLLGTHYKKNFSIVIQESTTHNQDELQVGYLKFSKLINHQ